MFSTKKLRRKEFSKGKENRSLPNIFLLLFLISFFKVLQPLNLSTSNLFLFQQRGRSKEEEFIRKLQEMLIEEEKQRIPIAQGLPWTTDEPEVRRSLKVNDSYYTTCLMYEFC